MKLLLKLWIGFRIFPNPILAVPSDLVKNASIALLNDATLSPFLATMNPVTKRQIYLTGAPCVP